MQVKTEVVLEFQKGDNVYRLSMAPNAPIGEIYDVGFQVIKKALELAQDAAAKAERPVQQEISPEIVSVQPTDPTPSADPAISQPTDCSSESCNEGV